MSSSPANQSSNANAAALQALLMIENEALEAQDVLTLKHIAVNRPRTLIRTGHILWVTRRGKDLTIEALSSQAVLDSTTPFAQWMMRQLKTRARSGGLNRLEQWEFEDTSKDTPFTYPFTQALYAPFSPDPKRGGLLFTRDHAFTETDVQLIKRLAKIFGISALAVRNKKRIRLNISKRLSVWSAASLLAIACVIPVPMTTLAPAEIVAGTPYVITAPFNGVIDDILIPPNTRVMADTPLIRFVDTSYRNEYILAGKEESIAEAKLRQAASKSFIDETARHDIVIAETEKSLANARKNYASDRLSKTIVTAPRQGLAIYPESANWRGRHVTTGEAIIHIADPANVRLRIEAPLSMGESLKKDARIKLFLDNDPLNALEAKLSSASYYARSMPSGHMAYEAYGDLRLADNGTSPRIGTRGVAKIYGEKALLGYWILRRPITIIRQTIGL